MKKLLLMFIISIVAFILLPAFSVSAAADLKEPEFHSLDIDKSEATGGEKIKVSVDASAKFLHKIAKAFPTKIGKAFTLL